MYVWDYGWPRLSSHLFFVWVKSSLRRNGKVIILNCTYKINCYHLLPLQFVGTTALKQLCYALFAFVMSETVASYRLPIEALKSMFLCLNIDPPIVFLTDKHKALRNCLLMSFPESWCLVCIWHINRQVLSHAQDLLWYEVEEGIRNVDVSKEEFQKALERKREEFIDG